MKDQQTYIIQTMQHNGVTITIRRPVLDEGEREKRAKQIVDGLEHSLRDYLRRGANHNGEQVRAVRT